LQSHIITIIFSSTIASIAAYLVLCKYRLLLEQIIKEITERRQIEEELKNYQYHFEEWVKELLKEQTTELKQANEQLQKKIVEHKRVEEALRESEGHYRTLFEDSPISLWEEDFSDVKAYIDSLRDSGVTNFRAHFENHPDFVATCAAMVKVVHINKVTLNLYKAGSKEEFKDGLNEIFTQESYKGFKEELIAIAENRTVFEREGIAQTLTGEKIHFELRWSVVPGYERRFSKVLVSIVNITERKQTEQKLKQTMVELERSNAELEQFAYVASHDLQQPLLILDCYVQLLAQRYKGKLDSEADDFIARLIEGVDRMQTMIKELLDYSRLDAKSTDFQRTDCGMVFGKAIANLQAIIDKHDVVVTHDHFPIVMAKDFLLVQLFQNLISNAIKFRSEEPPRIHVSVDQQENAWLFSVQDNGIGFDPRYTERIFTLFERIHGRRKYPGTGIGLAICKKIVERHGGSIWGESVPGKGATFYFTIPRTS
jgi:signal transduction histidine kinase